MSGAKRILETDLAARTVLAPMVALGYRRYRASGQTPTWGYRAMRRLYGAPRTDAFEAAVARTTREHPLLDLPASPEGVAAGVVDDLVDELRAEGIAVLPTRLDPQWCDELEHLARTTPCRLVDPLPDPSIDPGAKRLFDEDDVAAVRYDLDERAVVSSPAAQRLLADESLIAVAQAYFGAGPVQDQAAMWWSTAAGASPSSAAAQQFHFDLDRLRFVKFFVFLTDVDEANGPHVYVRGSHRQKPHALRQDGRHDDRSVSEAFPGKTTEITGPRGTMFLADTFGMHKGKDLARGHRLVFEAEYAASLFGAAYANLTVPLADPALATTMERHPAVFGRLDLEPAGGER